MQKFSLAQPAATAALLLVAAQSLAAATPTKPERKGALEEVIVTAQKREQSLQDAPIAISVLAADQLQAQGISSLDALGNGAVPALRTLPYANSPSTQVMAIRGNGPVDIGTVTREASVAVYVDGIYLGRPQGLSMEITDLQRIEVLRGPQGTLFGRNATSGAVNLVSKKPSGKFELEQTVSMGNYEAWRSMTRINLPVLGGLSAKFDYLHSQRDGWVENTTPGAADFNAYEKDGGRLALNYQAGNDLEIDYVYDKSRQETTQNYFQVYRDFFGLIGEERDRETKTRYPFIPLDPTITEPEGHALTLAWNAGEHLTVKSLSAYRKLSDDVNDNYGGALYFGGLMALEDAKQNQYSQEFQFIGSSERLEWLAGLYFFKEHVDQETVFLFSLNQGVFPFQPIDPPFQGGPAMVVKADSESQAVYGQATWTIPAWRDNMRITLGGRYTRDDKSGYRSSGGPRSEFDLDTSHFDPSVTFDVALTEAMSVYAKWGSAYRAGGVNPRSASFTPYEEEKVRTLEFGFKSEFLDRRVRLNADTFFTEYEGMQLTFTDPNSVLITETINAKRDIDVEGFEVDLTVVPPVEGLLVGLSYVYLDGDMPLQPNPLGNGALVEFELTQTPQHAGALTVDYTFQPLAIGTLAAHLDVTSTDQYTYVQDGGRFDAYTLINARLSLTDVPVAAGSLQFAVWGRNLADEEYIVMGFPSLPGSVVQAFGDPRTYGVDVTYKF